LAEQLVDEKIYRDAFMDARDDIEHKKDIDLYVMEDSELKFVGPWPPQPHERKIWEEESKIRKERFTGSLRSVLRTRG